MRIDSRAGLTAINRTNLVLATNTSTLLIESGRTCAEGVPDENIDI